MATDANMIFTNNQLGTATVQGASPGSTTWSNFTTMQDGTVVRFTTQPVTLYEMGVNQDEALTAEIFIPAFTNRQTIGVLTTTTIMTAAVQHAKGDRTVEANWADLAYFRQIKPRATGSGTGAFTNYVYSNRYVVRFQTYWSHVRLSIQYIGSAPDFSAPQCSVKAGTRRSRETD